MDPHGALVARHCSQVPAESSIESSIRSAVVTFDPRLRRHLRPMIAPTNVPNASRTKSVSALGGSLRTSSSRSMLCLATVVTSITGVSFLGEGDAVASVVLAPAVCHTTSTDCTVRTINEITTRNRISNP